MRGRSGEALREGPCGALEVASGDQNGCSGGRFETWKGWLVTAPSPGPKAAMTKPSVIAGHAPQACLLGITSASPEGYGARKHCDPIGRTEICPALGCPLGSP